MASEFEAALSRCDMKLTTSLRRVVCVLVLLGLGAAPVLAQVDLTGMWRPMPRNEDGSGMDGDYAGLPLNDGRPRAGAKLGA